MLCALRDTKWLESLWQDLSSFLPIFPLWWVVVYLLIFNVTLPYTWTYAHVKYRQVTSCLQWPLRIRELGGDFISSKYCFLILITLISSEIRDIVNYNLRESHKHVLLSFISLIYLSSPKDIFSFLLERKGWGERYERESDELPSWKHPDWGLNLQRGCVSWPGIKPATFQSTGPHSNPLTNTSQGCKPYFKPQDFLSHNIIKSNLFWNLHNGTPNLLNAHWASFFFFFNWAF